MLEETIASLRYTVHWPSNPFNDHVQHPLVDWTSSNCPGRPGSLSHTWSYAGHFLTGICLPHSLGGYWNVIFLTEAFDKSQRLGKGCCVDSAWHHTPDLILPLSHITVMVYLLVPAPNWITKVMSWGTCLIFYYVVGHSSVQGMECSMSEGIWTWVHGWNEYFEG